jgi:hypothetical protein
MVFVDDDFLVVSHYMLSPAGQFSSSLGWDLPQLKLKREAPWPFYEAFKRSFELAWRAARNAGPFELVELTMDEPTAGGMVEDRCMQLALADLLGTQPANVRRVETE